MARFSHQRITCMCETDCDIAYKDVKSPAQKCMLKQ